MPSKSTYLIAFLSVTTVSIVLHFFVFTELRRTLRKDFGTRAKRYVRLSAALFILMDSLFLLLYLRKRIPWEVPGMAQFILYPFTVWQFLMFIWSVILLPQALIRTVARFLHQTSGGQTRSEVPELSTAPEQ